jgi:hypothetical protein
MLHTLIHPRGKIPSFIHMSNGKPHDVNVLDELVPEMSAFYAMDCRYFDLKRVHKLHEIGFR